MARRAEQSRAEQSGVEVVLFVFGSSARLPFEKSECCQHKYSVPQCSAVQGRECQGRFDHGHGTLKMTRCFRSGVAGRLLNGPKKPPLLRHESQSSIADGGALLANVLDWLSTNL